MTLSATSLFIVLSAIYYPPVPKDSGKVDSFDRLMAHINSIAGRDDWKKDGWKDEKLQEALARIAEEMAAAGKLQGYKLPVSLADVKPAEGDAGRTASENTLIVLRGKDSIPSLGRCKACIVLAEGSVLLSGAEGCIVIAGGSVQIRSGKKNLIVARRDVSVTTDGDSKTGADGSLFVTGGTVRGHLNGSIVNAPRGISPSLGSHGVITFNTPSSSPSPRANGNVTEIKDAKLAFEPALKRNPLEGKIDVVEILPAGVRSAGGVVIRSGNGVEIVVRPGAEVTDGNGKPIPELAGWKLEATRAVSLGVPTAVFTKGDEEAIFELKPTTTRPRLGVVPPTGP